MTEIHKSVISDTEIDYGRQVLCGVWKSVNAVRSYGWTVSLPSGESRMRTDLRERRWRGKPRTISETGDCRLHPTGSGHGCVARELLSKESETCGASAPLFFLD